MVRHLRPAGPPDRPAYSAHRAPVRHGVAARGTVFGGLRRSNWRWGGCDHRAARSSGEPAWLSMGAARAFRVPYDPDSPKRTTASHFRNTGVKPQRSCSISSCTVRGPSDERGSGWSPKVRWETRESQRVATAPPPTGRPLHPRTSYPMAVAAQCASLGPRGRSQAPLCEG